MPNFLQKIPLFTRTYFLYIIGVCLVFTACTKNKVDENLQEYLYAIDSISQQKPKEGLRKIDSLLEKKQNSKNRALLLFSKGELFYLNDKLIEAKNIHLETYRLFTKLKDDYNKGRSLITLSGACIKLNELEDAQKYALEALEVGEKIGNTRIEGKANNQLFKLHFRLKDYEKALFYIKRSEELFTDPNDANSTIAIKSNIAGVYFKLKQYNKALEQFSEALKVGQSAKDPKTIVSVFNNIGYTYLEAKRFEEAENFLRGAIKLNKKIKTINGAPYKGLGALFLITNKLDSAEVNYNKAMSIYKSKNYLSEEIEIRDKLISIAILKKQYEIALNHQIIRDSIEVVKNKKQNQKLLHFANVNYKIKEKEIALTHQKEINKQNWWLGISVIVSLMLILIIALFIGYNNKLRAANKASKLEQRLLRAQMNPHFIFNTLAAIQNITLEGNPVKSSNYIAKFSKLIRQNFDYVRKEEISLEKELTMISNYIDTQQLRFNNSFSYHIHISENCNTKELNVPPMLLQPFVENAIEYGLKEKKSGGMLNLKIRKIGQELFFEIEDNGVGRKQKKSQEKIAKDLHATDIFIERLQTRNKGEEKSFTIKDLNDEEGNPSGTKVVFKLKL
ncbi:tetratricopeptide repeat protein [Tenacibaculum gallaicum]|uniref:Tetratricopeptide repeat protein n=1 Tax=Tenacibaculum gallaicum TaxID=561505 RepID=A0A3E0IDC0_9FLAO|nr:tetratricopeptide repeat protein [Tenacibaculum gallaicum]REH56735.1 tetratricopeptide repeat protein [Tenacibaculum gallaicum]